MFTFQESSHCHLFYSLNEAHLSTDALAHGWHQVMRKYAFPPVCPLAQTLHKIRENEEQVLMLVLY